MSDKPKRPPKNSRNWKLKCWAIQHDALQSTWSERDLATECTAWIFRFSCPDDLQNLITCSARVESEYRQLFLLKCLQFKFIGTVHVTKHWAVPVKTLGDTNNQSFLLLELQIKLTYENTTYCKLFQTRIWTVCVFQ